MQDRYLKLTDAQLNLATSFAWFIDPKDPDTEPVEYENGAQDAEDFSRWMDDEAEKQMEENL